MILRTPLEDMKILLSLFLLLGACAGPAPLLHSGLQGDVRAALGAVAPEARLSLWVADVDGREVLVVEADRRVVAASVVKVLILVEAHAQRTGQAKTFEEIVALAQALLKKVAQQAKGDN